MGDPSLPAHFFPAPRPRNQRQPRQNTGAFGVHATYGPPGPQFGNARWDAYHNRIPGDFGPDGMPIPKGPPGLTPDAKWNAMFPAAGTNTTGGGNGGGGAAAFDSAFHPDRVQAAVKSNSDLAMRTAAMANPAVAANIAAAQGNMAAGAKSAAANNAAAQRANDAATQSVAANDTAAGARTRIGAGGNVETLMDSRSGPRWVGSTTSAPPMTNFRPGDAGTNSLADTVTHEQKAAPAPIVRPDGTKIAPDIADQAAYYRPGGAFGDTIAVDKAGGYGSSRVLGRDDAPVTTSPAEVDAIAKRYGGPSGGKVAASGLAPTYGPFFDSLRPVGTPPPASPVASATPPAAPKPDPTAQTVPGVMTDRQWSDYLSNHPSGFATGGGSAEATPTSPSPAENPDLSGLNGTAGIKAIGQGILNGAGKLTASMMHWDGAPSTPPAPKPLSSSLPSIVANRGTAPASPDSSYPRMTVDGLFGGGQANGSASSPASTPNASTLGTQQDSSNYDSSTVPRDAFGTPVKPLKSAVATMQQVADNQPQRQDLQQSAGWSGSDDE